MLSASYYRRVFAAYLGRGRSQLSFWHEEPALNEQAFEAGSWQYYMTFDRKADYAGPFDDEGIPLLDYRGAIGRQYNPIAVAQYGLAGFNRWCRLRAADAERAGMFHHRFLTCADWLASRLELNKSRLKVWMHLFDWEYFQTLKAPWYSGLAQGQGLSLLVRAYHETRAPRYLRTAESALLPMLTAISEGGVLDVDAQGLWWIEEYLTEPPTHIVNGLMWALWGVWDYLRAEDTTPELRSRAEELWRQSLHTLESALERYDCGYWSRYDLAPVGRPNVASPFYHRLHIAQLRVMHRLTGNNVFRRLADRWQGYQASAWNRARARAAKTLFKLLYY